MVGGMVGRLVQGAFGAALLLGCVGGSHGASTGDLKAAGQRGAPEARASRSEGPAKGGPEENADNVDQGVDQGVDQPAEQNAGRSAEDRQGRRRAQGREANGRNADGEPLSGAPDAESETGTDDPSADVDRPAPGQPSEQTTETDPTSADDEPRAEHRARVLIFEPEAKRMAVYDAAGQQRYDLWPQLGIDGPDETITVSVGNVTYSGDGEFRGRSLLRREAKGLPAPTPTRLLIGRARDDGNTDVELWALDGRPMAQLRIPQHWTRFALSPAEKYLFAEQRPPPITSSLRSRQHEVAIVRIADGEVVWRGRHYRSCFAPDDSHLVLALTDDTFAAVLDLTSLTMRDADHTPVHKYTSPEFRREIRLNVEACTPWGAVLRTTGPLNDGWPLWSLGWDGRLHAFDASLPHLAIEAVLDFRSEGRIVRWRREPVEPYGDLEPIDEALLGYFEYDMQASTHQRIERPNRTCTNERDRYLSAQGTTLYRCVCPSWQCDPVADLPTPEGGWLSLATASPDGETAIVSYHWSGNALDTGHPDGQLFHIDGHAILNLPHGQGQYDRDSELVLFESYAGERPFAIIDLRSLELSWLGRPDLREIVYE